MLRRRRLTCLTRRDKKTPVAKERNKMHQGNGIGKTIIKTVLGLVGVSFFVGFRSTRSFANTSSANNNHFRTEEEWLAFVQDYQRRFHRPPPPGMKEWHRFATQHQCETQNYYETLEADMQYFRPPNNSLKWDRVLPEATQLSEHYMAFSLENHNLTVVGYQAKKSYDPHERRHRRAIERLLRFLLEPVIRHDGPPLNSTFVFNLHDTAQPIPQHYLTRNTSTGQFPQMYPIFSVCKMDYYTDGQPPPSPFGTTTNVNTNTTSPPARQEQEQQQPTTIQNRDLMVPWHFSLRRQSRWFWFWPWFKKGRPFHRRRNAITWRGSTTGVWETGPRFQLVREYANQTNTSSQTGVEVDFAFFRVVQKPDHVPEWKDQHQYRFAPHMRYWQMQQFKYIMDVDGNGFTSRFPGLLRSGSVVFKSTRYREWFHGILQPYRDYIPVNYNLSDLPQKLAWAQGNTQAMEQMAVDSKQQVERFLRPVDMQCYMYRLLLEYQTLFE
ncbi:KDEL motif-containing protein 2 [Seminavis robusta]|uniref:KDEL motif-containing protein 2 n=1 Tax=Seminavis robusta TaxID=568900 RepID=A0A9N8DFG1_9STRA|nr:KDEL motif-containing protein 2 [Seminavis robusta]|eukprot:Sro118_g057790.1 KDEL motif-containing protein 2 (495) ;mRNA; f:77366-78953